MHEKMMELERRIECLEVILNVENKRNDLVRIHGDTVDKSTAAQMLGVTRATVYAMLSDGRIEGACQGRRVSVRSIAKYIDAPKSPGRTGNPGGAAHED